MKLATSGISKPIKRYKKKKKMRKKAYRSESQGRGAG
jgi:hypothetical protein